MIPGELGWKFGINLILMPFFNSDLWEITVYALSVFLGTRVEHVTCNVITELTLIFTGNNNNQETICQYN